MAAYRVLVVEDDIDQAKMLNVRLACKGIDVISAKNGLEGLKLAYQHHPDLVILDVVMPEMDGYETCRRLRELSDVPILMLTAKSEKGDVLQGYHAGADDYIVKPFRMWELEERVFAMLKRSRLAKQPATLYDDGTLRVDLERQAVYRANEPVHLTPTEFRLLAYMVQNPSCVLERDELLSHVWGANYLDARENLAIYIHYLRDKLDDSGSGHQYIRTRWGVGYWFAPRQAESKSDEPA
jgi:two-component system KDP operon response regulator KdpE